MYVLQIQWRGKKKVNKQKRTDIPWGLHNLLGFFPPYLFRSLLCLFVGAWGGGGGQKREGEGERIFSLGT